MEQLDHARAYIESVRDYWGTYHNHKETTAFTAATVYIAAAVSLTAKPDLFGPCKLWALLVGGVLAGLGFAFVVTQLRNKRFAATYVAGCFDLLALWLHEPPAKLCLDPVPSGRGYDVPKCLKDAVDATSKDTNEQASIAPRWTYMLMVTLTVFAGVRVFLS
jgi:hypothetical protein